MSENQIVAVVSENIAHEVHEEAFYLSAEFWVGMAFVLVLIVIYKPLSKAINTLISNRINRIKKEFNEAENLKLDAQKIYADYERKILNVEKEVENIISEQQLFINETKEQKIKELNARLKQKEKEVEGKIELTYIQLKKQINMLVVKKSNQMIKETLKLKLTKADYNNLIDKSISNINNIKI